MQRIPHAAHARILCGLIVCLIALQTRAVPKPLPEAVVRAHTVFLENETGFLQLQYSTTLELTKWGHFDLADNRDKADLVMRLESASHVRVVPQGQFPSSGGDAAADGDIPRGYTRISLLDPKTDTVLWSDTHKAEGGKVKNGHLLDGLREAFNSYEKGRR
jgi:hypothetical protein